MYLDPGFGSMVIQMVIGLIAASGAGMYIFRQKLAKLFKHSSAKEKDTVNTASDDGK
jgi:hypothetical protein